MWNFLLSVGYGQGSASLHWHRWWIIFSGYCPHFDHLVLKCPFMCRMLAWGSCPHSVGTEAASVTKEGSMLTTECHQRSHTIVSLLRFQALEANVLIIVLVSYHVAFSKFQNSVLSFLRGHSRTYFTDCCEC